MALPSRTEVEAILADADLELVAGGGSYWSDNCSGPWPP